MIKISETTKEAVKGFTERQWRATNIEHYGKGIQWIEKEFTYKAEIGGKIVGVISGRLSTDVLYINDLIVTSRQRGKGIGHSLMQKAEEFGKKEGAIKAHLLTGKGWKAQKFYESLDYKQIAVFPKHHFGRDNLVYQKPL